MEARMWIKCICIYTDSKICLTHSPRVTMCIYVYIFLSLCLLRVAIFIVTNSELESFTGYKCISQGVIICSCSHILHYYIYHESQEEITRKNKAKDHVIQCL